MSADHLPPLIVHVIDRLAIGGMENGIVNLINGTPRERFRHAIVCLRTADDFRHRIDDPDIPIVELHKRPGKDIRIYYALWRRLKELAPAIVHTRNLPTIDMVPIAAAACVPWRVHGEHGRDVAETYGDNKKYNLLCRAVSPMVDQYIAVSRDIEGWLGDTVGVPERKVRQIYNGVDTKRFAAITGEGIPAEGFDQPGLVVIGTVGRLEVIKDQLNLVRAFIRLVTTRPKLRSKLRLAIIGTGSQIEAARAVLAETGTASLAWLPGARDDVPALLRAMDVFVLPSINEGISNTIIEAMATGLPVVATEVGGNGELVVPGETGALVPRQDPEALADAIARYAVSPELRAAHGAAARKRVEDHFSLQAMIDAYLGAYDTLLTRSSRANGRVLADRATTEA